jgi:hypothetical protein
MQSNARLLARHILTKLDLRSNINGVEKHGVIRPKKILQKRPKVPGLTQIPLSGVGFGQDQR